MSLIGENETLKRHIEFVASMTVCASDVRKIRQNLTLSSSRLDPLKNTLVTPIFMSDGALKAVRELVEEKDGRQVFFDSGGYYVQLGRIKYEELYLPLLSLYRKQNWAGVYVLPDHVPLSQDSVETVARKVDDTIRVSRLFFHELPDELKTRAMPVVQGHSYRHIDRCLEAYFRLGVSRIGFGSFGTSGKNGEINVTTKESITLAKYVCEAAHSVGIKVHFFGIGRPALLAMLYTAGADTFDSSSWMKAAGFGQVFLPFSRGYNVTYNTSASKLELSISQPDFRNLSNISGHQCKLCDDFSALQQSKMRRAVHNLIAVAETTKTLNEGDFDLIDCIYRNGSPKYREEAQKWLLKHSQFTSGPEQHPKRASNS